MRSEAVLSADRVGLMNRIRDASIIEARDLGIDIIDVRLKRADLPEQNLEATFDRMKAEREREAADERARGNEAAQRVRAQADRTAIEIVSEAERDADRSSAARATPSATASWPRPTAPIRSSSPSCARWTPTAARSRPTTPR